MRKRIVHAVIVAALVVAGAPPAAAQSAQGRVMQAKEEHALAADVARTNEMCQANIALALDWSRAPFSELERREAGTVQRHCDAALDSIRSICDAHGDRGAVKTQIRRLVCTFAGEEPVALNDGELRFRIDVDWPAANDRLMIRDYLVDHLTVDGETLRLRHTRPANEATLATRATHTNELCGSNIVASIDWSGIPAERVKDHSALNYCEHVFDVADRICTNAPGRDAVRQQIRRIRCSYAPTRSFELKDGVFDFKSDFKASDDRSTILEYLQNRL